MPDKLTPAELAEGLRLESDVWCRNNVASALRELAALREQLAAERERRAALVAKWRAAPWKGQYTEGLFDAADQLAALDAPAVSSEPTEEPSE